MANYEDKLLRRESYIRRSRDSALGLMGFGTLGAVGVLLIGDESIVDEIPLEGLSMVIILFALMAYCYSLKLRHIETIKKYRGELPKTGNL